MTHDNITPRLIRCAEIPAPNLLPLGYNGYMERYNKHSLDSRVIDVSKTVIIILWLKINNKNLFYSFFSSNHIFFLDSEWSDECIFIYQYNNIKFWVVFGGLSPSSPPNCAYLLTYTLIIFILIISRYIL